MTRKRLKDAAGMAAAGTILAGSLLTAMAFMAIMGAMTGAIAIACGISGRDRRRKEKA